MTITSQNWQRVVELFDRALAAFPAERGALLKEFCSDDPNLEEYILQLVEAYQRAGSILGSSATSRAFAPLHLVPGEYLGDRFRIVRLIGSGGMGIVYEAEDVRLRERIALKTLRRDTANKPGDLSALRRETTLARRVAHPNICRVFDLEIAKAEGDDIAFLTMEYLEGETLAERLQHEERLPIDMAKSLSLQIARGLDAAHRKGIVHGDLKTANVFVVPDPASEDKCRAVIADFKLTVRCSGDRAWSSMPKKLHLASTRHAHM
jgi:serine/threonine protein kinase